MAIKKQNPAPEEITSTIEYKQQQEFFAAVYEYFREYQEKYADFYTDANAGIPAFKALIKLISSSKAQLSKVTDMKELDKLQESALKKLKSKDSKEAREELDKLSTKVFEAFETIGISPTIHDEHDKLKEFWTEEEHAGIREMKKAFYDSFMLPEE